ncbi:ankyrin, partial [Neurospora tetrasperma FGSC 2509]
AAITGYEAVVKLLLDTGKVNADAKDGATRIALHIAAENGQEGVVKLLLDTGKVDPDPKDKNGQTALYMAIEKGHKAVIKLLLDTSAFARASEMKVSAKDVMGPEAAGEAVVVWARRTSSSAVRLSWPTAPSWRAGAGRKGFPAEG